MAKTWGKMTEAEKIEDLRNDVKTIMATVNHWIQQQQQLGVFHHDLMTKHTGTSNLLSEVAATVKKLEKEIAKLKQ